MPEPASSGAETPGPAPAPRRWLRRLLLGCGGLLAALLGVVLWVLFARLGPMGAGYYAKVLCACVFESGRDPADVRAAELYPADLSVLLHLVDGELDREQQRVRASFLGVVDAEAVYRDGVGTVLVHDDLRPMPAPAPVPPPADPAALWPQGEAVGAPPAGVDAAALSAALEAAFAEPDPARPTRRTRAVVVVWRGRIVAERYAEGYGPHTPQLGWSMTKTIAGALAGVLVRDGRWRWDAPVPVPEWGPGDPRAAITLGQLLQMQPALEFAEVYSPLTDVTTMLFARPDSAAYAAAKPLVGTPGSVWNYSSGTTNIVCRAMRAELGDAAYASFPRDALFAPLGMTTAKIDVDAAGTFVGSSFGWMSARDWARFGLLWVQDGVWEGQRVLPEGWVERSRQPAEHSGGRYGAHVWLRLHRPGPNLPQLPADTFHAAGHDRQLLTMIPSRELVVLRLGLTRQGSAWVQERLVDAVLGTLPAAD